MLQKCVNYLGSKAGGKLSLELSTEASVACTLAFRQGLVKSAKDLDTAWNRGNMLAMQGKELSSS